MVSRFFVVIVISNLVLIAHFTGKGKPEHCVKVTSFTIDINFQLSVIWPRPESMYFTLTFGFELIKKKGSCSYAEAFDKNPQDLDQSRRTDPRGSDLHNLLISFMRTTALINSNLHHRTEGLIRISPIEALMWFYMLLRHRINENLYQRKVKQR